jgi:hypothetical protein
VGKFLFQWKARFSNLGKLIDVVCGGVFLTILLHESFVLEVKG